MPKIIGLIIFPKTKPKNIHERFNVVRIVEFTIVMIKNIKKKEINKHAKKIFI